MEDAEEFFSKIEPLKNPVQPLDEVIKKYVLRAFKVNQYNLTVTARDLNISIRTLRNYFHKWQITPIHRESLRNHRKMIRVAVKCTHCEKEFTISRYLFNYKLNAGKKEFFCSNNHSAQHRNRKSGY